MNSLLLPGLIAASVVLAVVGIVQAMNGAMSRDKRKLHQRLSLEGLSSKRRSLPQAITRQLEGDAQGLDGWLLRFSIFQSIYRWLLKAYPQVKLARFLLVVFCVGMITFVLAGTILNSMFIGLVAGGIGAYVPVLLIINKRNRRQKTIAAQLPEALEFLSRILRAGHSFATGLQMMGQELPQPLAGEFSRCYDQHSLGQSLEEALKDLAAGIDSTDFAFFVTAVLIQRQTGGDLSEVLDNISGMIRQRVRLQQHVKAKTAEGRFTGYILVAFPALMFLISYTMNPKQAELLLHGSGLVLLGVAFSLQMLGLFAIRKITTVRV